MGHVNYQKRNQLIDEYYNAIDDEMFAAFDRVFANNVEYRYPGKDPMHGVDEVRLFFEEERDHSDSTHTVTRRVADNEVTVCEGTVTAERSDGSPFEAGFVGVFEFDDGSEAITRVEVYTR